LEEEPYIRIRLLVFYRRDSVQNDVELPPAFLVWLLPINVRDLTHGGDFYYQLCVASFDRDNLRLLYVEWFVPLKGVDQHGANYMPKGVKL